MSKQKSCVASHTNAVVCEAVEEEHGLAITLAGLNDPGAEQNVIWRCYGNVLDLGADRVEGLAHCGFLFVSQGTARRVQCSVGHENAGDCAEPEVQDQ